MFKQLWIKPNHRPDSVDRLDVLAGTGDQDAIAELLFVLNEALLYR